MTSFYAASARSLNPGSFAKTAKWPIHSKKIVNSMLVRIKRHSNFSTLNCVSDGPECLFSPPRLGNVTKAQKFAFFGQD